VNHGVFKEQTTINRNMRLILIDWLFSVSYDLKY